MRHFWVISLIALFVISCNKDEQSLEKEEFYKLDIPDWAPMLNIPSDNPLTLKKVELGEELFFDPILSRTGKISCGSCHLPDKTFTDGQTVSTGVEGRLGIRNSPTLYNVAYVPKLMWDGGPRSLEAQVALPFDDHNEFDFSVAEVLERLKSDNGYSNKFNAVFGVGPSAKTLAQALSSYERTLLSFDSPFDEFEYENNPSALTPIEQRGRDLFFSKELACSECHSPPLFSNFQFLNNGLYQEGDEDPGRYRITFHQPDKGKFKVPTLRNVETTAPYMHDGRFKSLEEVVEHYNNGGHDYRTQDARVKPLNLTEVQKAELVSFLKALTDPTI